MTELPIDENTPRILIVEDEPKLGQLLIDYLRAASYAPTLISHGDQVLPYVRQTPPDLILLDLMLPGTDGLTLCREIRRFSDIPIVMVTAKIEEIDRLLGLEIGADDYICKPYSPREVVARVKTILRRCKPQRELQQQDAESPLIIDAALRIFLGNSLTQFPDDFIAFINTKHRFHGFQTTQFDDPHSQILIIVGLNNRHIFNKNAFLIVRDQ